MCDAQSKVGDTKKERDICFKIRILYMHQIVK